MKKELQSKDLRIGNLVNWGSNIVPIKSIHTESVLKKEVNVYVELNEKLQNYCLSIFEITPIQLTEDLCKQHISFKSRIDESYMYDIFEDEYGFHFVIDTYRDCHEIMRITKKIKFVHEWQNLYFVITDNELILEFTNP